GRWFPGGRSTVVLGLCAFVRGGTVVSCGVFWGARLRGPLGALAARGGLLGPPMILIIAVGALYAHYGDLPALRRMLTRIAAAAAGLMLATVAKMARPLFNGSFKSSAGIAPIIAVATFAAIGILHWPLPLVLLVIVPLSIVAKTESPWPGQIRTCYSRVHIGIFGYPSPCLAKGRVWWTWRPMGRRRNSSKPAPQPQQ